ncbi:MAG: xanthine dehydrogenase family protein [Candidatus Tectomicrobia bacterium]|nr:xanthine dehydrogenase family protein [Candidatus Tectomicrobia bacterium]
MTYQVIGHSVARRDGVEKVTGLAAYTSNLSLPRMLHGKILRSPLPHARIVAIDASRARRLPGVKAVLTRDTLLGDASLTYRYGHVLADQAIVAVDRVRFVGDAVAAVAAVDRDVAEEALSLIDVEYEELPAVFTAEESFGPAAPLIHETPPEVQARAAMKFDGPRPGTNICASLHIRHGDIDRGFAAADFIFEDTYSTPMQAHCPLEPHVTVADWHPSGRLTVWSSTQMPFQVRDHLARIFRLPKSQVCVLVDNVGGGYGAKTGIRLEPITSLLARLSGCPVKTMLNREEVFLTLTRHGNTFWVRTGVSRDGRLIARHIRILWDTGAYADAGPIVIFKAGYTASGPYNIPNVVIDSYCIYTNKPPAGPLRGMGVPQTTWAYEPHLDRIAAELGFDPIELRRQNIYRNGDTFVSGETLHSIDLAGCFDRALETDDWQPLGYGRRRTSPSKAASLEAANTAGSSVARGRGLACALKNTSTPSYSGATLKMNEDGTVVLLTGAVEIGQGCKTALAQITAEALSLPLERVRVATTNTDVVPFDWGTISGRTIFHVGKAIQEAAAQLREQLIALAADVLEAAPQDLELAQGRIVARGAPDKGITYEDALLRRLGIKGSGLIAHGEFRTHWYKADPGIEGCTSPFWDVGLGLAEVEVDRDTGKVRLLRYRCVADVGTAVNPALCRGQLSGATLMGLGQALFEEMLFDNGQPINPSLVNYKIPSSRDIPEVLEVNYIESGHQEGPYGAKGIGEIGVAPAAPAVASAIHDALGVWIVDLPITPEKILRALEAREATLRREAGAGAG